MKVKLSLIKIIVVVAAVSALLYSLGALGPGAGTSDQGTVVRAEVTLDGGAFEVQLITRSSVSGERDWVPPGRSYTGTYVQDVLVAPGERMVFWLTAATDIDRDIEKRTLKCQIYVDGKALPPPGTQSRPIRRGSPGEPVGCQSTGSRLNNFTDPPACVILEHTGRVLPFGDKEIE